MAVLSRTVMDTTVTGTSAPRGKTPGTRTSCQSEWILQISTESKYLPGSDTHFCNMDWCLNLCQVHKKIFMNFFISLIHWYFKSDYTRKKVQLRQLLIYLMKSQKSIQNRPSSARWAHSSLFRCGGQLGQSSAQGPVQEKRPHGFLSCSNLKQEAGVLL